MNLLSPEQLAASPKAGVDTFLALVDKTYEGWCKLAELNLRTAKATLAQIQQRTLDALPLNQPQAVFALQTGLTEPLVETFQTYVRQSYDIVAATQAEFVAAAEAQYQTQSRHLQSAVESFVSRAPAGSEAVVAVLKSTISSANTLNETLRNTVKHAVEVAGSNLAIVTSSAAPQAKRQANGQARHSG